MPLYSATHFQFQKSSQAHSQLSDSTYLESVAVHLEASSQIREGIWRYVERFENLFGRVPIRCLQQHGDIRGEAKRRKDEILTSWC